ncbi:MAG TPA: amidohydrolase [Gemmatimonadaceae bacterium]|nr:amidohydrolase [Gemmatimonadaceae bacterium]
MSVPVFPVRQAGTRPPVHAAALGVARALTAAALIALLPVAAAAQRTGAPPRDARVAALVERFAPQAIQFRQQIHQNPELGNREFKTAELVAAHLRSLGFDEVRTGIAHTGVVGVLRGGRPGPVVAVRADMDALPVTEDTPFPFKSTVRSTYLGQDIGVSHACGHDIHTAVQLGVASVLTAMRAEIPGTVLFIFQPAEEGPPPGEEGGAKLMLEQGAFANPRPVAVFGLHTFSEMEVGTVGYTPGPSMAASDHFVATIRGRQAHGAAPHLSVDPVVMASQVVLALQTIRSRNLSPFEPSVVTVGIIRGGERHNIIPAEVRLEGTVRTFDAAVQDTVERRIKEIFDGITRAGGGSFELEYDRGYPVTVNDVALAARMRPTLERLVGPEKVLDLQATTGAEDFSYFANQVPGFFYRLGMVKPGTVSGGHHTPTFLADDSSVPVGMRVMTALLLDFLANERAANDAAGRGGRMED